MQTWPPRLVIIVIDYPSHIIILLVTMSYTVHGTTGVKLTVPLNCGMNKQLGCLMGMHTATIEL